MNTNHGYAGAIQAGGSGYSGAIQPSSVPPPPAPSAHLVTTGGWVFIIPLLVGGEIAMRLAALTVDKVPV